MRMWLKNIFTLHGINVATNEERLFKVQDNAGAVTVHYADFENVEKTI